MLLLPSASALPLTRVLPLLLVLVGAVIACSDQGEIVARQHIETPPGVAGAGGAGAQVDRPVFGAPTVVTELSDPVAKDQDPTLTEDLLEIFFFSDRSGNEEIWTSRRASVSDPWAAPTLVAELASTEFEENPAVSRDGLRLWFYSRREPLGIWYSERATRDEAWSAPVAVPLVSPAGGAIAPTVDVSELRLAVSVGAAEARDIYETQRASRDDGWGALVPILGVNGDAPDSTPFFIDDGRELLLSSGRAGNGDLFWGWRQTVAASVTLVEPLDELNDPGAFESHPHLSVDRRTIFFGSDRSGGTDIYMASVP